MVDTSLNPTGHKSTAAASQAPVAVSKASPAASQGKPSPITRDGFVSPADAGAALSAVQQPAAQQSTPIVSKVSGLTTYRDHESGRLVVQIFDQKRGDVILEFPTENMLRNYPASASSQSIDHIIETKA